MNAQRCLWIHGWGMSAAVWDEVIKRIPSMDHHFVDFRGCRTPQELRDAAAAPLLRRPGAWNVVGWSMGGMLALELAHDEQLRRIVRIDKLAIVASTLRFVSRDRSRGWPERMILRMKRKLNGEAEQVLHSFREQMFSDYDKMETVKSIAHLREIQSDFDVDGLQAGLDYLLNTDLTDVWRRRNTDGPPVLWIHGTDDVVCPFAAAPESGHGVEIASMPGAGHAPFASDPERFSARLRSFLNPERDAAGEISALGAEAERAP